jgi:CrcB protein
MIKVLFVGLGGFVGSVLRYLCGLLLFKYSTNFPLHTLIINFVGSFAIGFIMDFSTKISPINANILLLLTVGVCGGFTTFSTFSLETIHLFEKGKIVLGIGYIFASLILCLFGVLLGKNIIGLMNRG